MSMEDKNGYIRIVVVVAFVAMGRINSTARIVRVESCSKPHIVLPEKIVSIKDTVFLLCTFVSE